MERSVQEYKMDLKVVKL